MADRYDAPSPYRLYRPGKLARLLDVNNATIWRWRITGVLPPPVHIGGIKGWREDQLRHLLRFDSDKPPKRKVKRVPLTARTRARLRRELA